MPRLELESSAAAWSSHAKNNLLISHSNTIAEWRGAMGVPLLRTKIYLLDLTSRLEHSVI
ncbi:MAG: hypothetical protein ACLVGX_05030 [Oscillospiraceae bacterium]